MPPPTNVKETWRTTCVTARSRTFGDVTRLSNNEMKHERMCPYWCLRPPDRSSSASQIIEVVHLWTRLSGSVASSAFGWSMSLTRSRVNAPTHSTAPTVYSIWGSFLPAHWTTDASHPRNLTTAKERSRPVKMIRSCMVYRLNLMALVLCNIGYGQAELDDVGKKDSFSISDTCTWTAEGGEYFADFPEILYKGVDSRDPLSYRYETTLDWPRRWCSWRILSNTLSFLSRAC